MLECFIDQRGDKGAALLTLLQRYIHYCKYKLYPLNKEDEQDMLQEVCIKLLKNNQPVVHNCSGWLFKVVRNEYIDQLRKKNRLNRLIEPDHDGNLVDAEQKSTLPIKSGEHLLQEADCLQHVFDHIEQQRSGKEDLVIYTDFALGVSNAEIAQKTGRTTGAIAKRLSLLRQRVKQLKEALC